MAVFQELAPGDVLMIGPDTRIRMERKSGSRARLRIDSTQDIERVPAGQPAPQLQATKTPAAAATKPQPGPFLRRPG
ncbi:hypothetical protein [Rhodanobacter lindaniclasticus]